MLALAGGWAVDVTSSRHADALPLNRLDADDVAAEFRPRGGRNVAYARDELRVSRTGGRHTWSLLARQNATLVGTHDAFDLARTVESEGTPEASHQWNVHAKYLGFAGAGAAWRGTFDVAGGWSAHAGLQGLVLSQWREYQLDGPAAYDAALQRWQFDLRYRRTDSRLEYPFQQAYDGRGQALLTEGGLRWSGADAAVAVSWRDAGWLRWRGLPQQDAVLSTDTQAVDADGFVIYKPLVQGRFSQATRRRTVAGIVNVMASWASSPATLWSAGADRVPGFGFLPQVKVQHRLGSATWTARYDLHERRAGVGWGWHGWQVAYGVDRVDGDARSREFRLGYSWSGD